MKKSVNSALTRLGILFLILLVVSSAGCIKLVQKNHDNSTEFREGPASPASQVQRTPQSSGSLNTATGIQQINFADRTDPILPADNERIIRNLSEKNGEVPSLLLRESLTSRTPVYHLKFSPQYNATAVRVNVTSGPLVIVYNIAFRFKDPHDSFAVITVRDYVTKEVIASETAGQIPKESLDSVEYRDETRQIVLPREGQFHINVYGNQCDVDLSVYSGDSPQVSGSSAGSVTPEGNTPAEYDLG
jgi:hypothetical protein